MLCFVFAALVVLLDQFFKRWIVITLAGGGESMEIIPGVLSLIYVENTGAAFSILADQRWLLVGVSLAVSLLLIAILLRYNDGFWGTLGLSAVLGGAVGNLIDRAFYGYVVDMFKPLIFPNFAIFNIADVFITLGGITFCVFFIITSVRAEKDALREGAPEEDDFFDESYDPYDPSGEQYDEVYDSSADTRVIPTRRGTHADEPQQVYYEQEQQVYDEAEPEYYEAEPENYEPGQEYYEVGQEQQENYEAGLEQSGHYEAGLDQSGHYETGLDQTGHYETGQEQDEYYDAGLDQKGKYVTETEQPNEATSALDALGLLELELSETDLLGDYNIDDMLREYGFEDNKE